MVLAIKFAHDYVKEYNKALVDRYIEIVSRLSALLIGTFALEMLFEGIGTWLHDTTPTWKR